MKRVYLDNAATTPLNKIALLKTIPYLFRYGNPSSVHLEGRTTRMDIENARKTIAKILNCKSNEIFFTSGASEGNAFIAHNFDCIISDTSHDSMYLTKNKNVSHNKYIYCYPYVNSETGKKENVVYDKAFNCIFCVDLTAIVGKEKINLSQRVKDASGEFIYAIDCATFSGHKFGAVKGCGVLFIREELQKELKPIIYGHQENGLRGGTENYLGIMNLTQCLIQADKNMYKNNNHIQKVKNILTKELNQLKINYATYPNSPIVNITFKTLLAQSAVQIFDNMGIAISAGSACNSKSDEPSRVLLANRYSEYDAMRTIRVSLGKQNTVREVKKFIKALKKVIELEY